MQIARETWSCDVTDVYLNAAFHAADARRKPQQESMPWDGVDPCSYYFQGRNERRCANMTKISEVHGKLRVHPTADLPSTIDEIMHRQPKQKRPGRHRTAGIAAAPAAR